MYLVFIITHIYIYIHQKMSNTLEYLNSVNNYDTEVGNLQAKAIEEADQEDQTDETAGGIGSAISGQILKDTVTSQAFKNAAKNILKTGNEDVDNAVDGVIEGDNPVDVANNIISNVGGRVLRNIGSKINDATDGLRDRVNDTLSKLSNTKDEIKGVRSRARDILEGTDESEPESQEQTFGDDDVDTLDGDINDPLPPRTGDVLPSQLTINKPEDVEDRTTLQDDFNTDDLNEMSLQQPRTLRQEIFKSEQPKEEMNDEPDVNQEAQKALGNNEGDDVNQGIELKNVGENAGEDVGEDVAENVGEDAGIAVGDAGLEAAGAALDSTGIGALVGIPLGIAGLAGSLVGLFEHHKSKPSISQLASPVFEAGV
eukprot:m.274167 g.274167  ORF g.274167 m.274167 type:complete len:370 (-) comp67625_c0_seq1:196-1305(-)